MLHTELGKGKSVIIGDTKVTIDDVDDNNVRLGTETKLTKGSTVMIAGADVTVMSHKNNKVKLGIDADQSIKISHERKNAVQK